MIVPQHIWDYIQRMENELQRRYEKTKDTKIRIALKDLKSNKDVLKFHQNNSEHSLEGENLEQTSFLMLNELKRIYLKGEYLIYPGLSNVSCEVSIEPELEMALNKTALQVNDDQLQNEAREIKRFLSSGTPNEVWTPYDELADYRVFKYISTPRKWRYLFEKNPKVYNMTFDFKRIKIACLRTEIELSERIHFLGIDDMREFWKLFDDDDLEKLAKKWLRAGITCIYYIYIPVK